MDLFTGTAEYYDEFRPGLPQEVVDTILSKVPVPIALLDLGCGTGRITEQLAPHFKETIGAEPDKDMAKLARKRLEKLPAQILHARAEDVDLPEGWRASLVLICRAFHWMDQKNGARAAGAGGGRKRRHCDFVRQQFLASGRRHPLGRGSSRSLISSPWPRTPHLIGNLPASGRILWQKFYLTCIYRA